MALNKRLIWYGIAGFAGVAIVGGAYYFAGGGDKPVPTAVTAPDKAAKGLPDEPAAPTSAQSDKILLLVGQARQLASEGKFAEAEASLDAADKVVRGLPEVAQARSEIADMKTPQGQLATQLTRARLAVDHGDWPAAEKALAEVERLNPQAPEIVDLRQQIEKRQAKETHHDNRIAEHLTAMREAIARGDFATANGELNAAERLDVADPSVGRARVELNRARNAASKKD